MVVSRALPATTECFCAVSSYLGDGFRIISKLFWARDSRSTVQFEDVRNLLATGYDDVYLRHWIRQLGLDNLLQECLQ